MKNNQKNKGAENNLFNNQIQGKNITNIINIYNHHVPNSVKFIKRKPLIIFKHIKTKWIGITGLIALIADIVTLYVFFNHHKAFDSGLVNSFLFINPLIFIISIIALSIFISAKNSGMTFGNYKIISSNGRLFIDIYK